MIQDKEKKGSNEHRIWNKIIHKAQLLDQDYIALGYFQFFLKQWMNYLTQQYTMWWDLIIPSCDALAMFRAGAEFHWWVCLVLLRGLALGEGGELGQHDGLSWGPAWARLWSENDSELGLELRCLSMLVIQSEACPQPPFYVNTG